MEYACTGKIFLRDNILKHGSRNATSTRVQDVGEMVLRQHRVGGVVAARIRPRLELRLSTGADDTR